MLRSSLLLATVLFAVASPIHAQSVRLNGDVNNDGLITAIDALAVLKASVELPLDEGFTQSFGDSDCDGKVTPRDAQIILSHVVSLDVAAFCVAKPAGGGVALVTIESGTGSVLVGGELQLLAVARDSTNKELEGHPMTWVSSDTTKATVSDSGLVTGIAAGTVTITSTTDGKTGSATITVLPAGGTTTFTISPSVTTVLMDSTVQLTATVRDAAGNPVSGKTITWATADAAKVTVSDSGLVKGLALGTVTITAKADGLTDASAQVSVVSLAAQANRTWNGSVSSDWSTAANWTPTGVPIATDTISIPKGTPNQAKLQIASATVAGLVISPEATLNIGANELQVTGRVDVDGEVIGTGKLTIQGLNQSTSLVRGKLPNVGVAGRTVIVGPTTIVGSMEQVAGSIIDLNGYRVDVSQNINIRGALLMRTTSSILDARGNARFFTDQSTTETDLSAGTLRVGGNLAVVVPAAAATATSPFPARGTHRVILDGAAKQIVADTGLAVVEFQEMVVGNTSGGVEFFTHKAEQRFRVKGRFIATTSVAISGEGRVNALSHFSTAGGSVTLRNLAVGGVLAAGEAFMPDTLTLLGTDQSIPAGAAYQYQNLVAAGSSRFTATTNITGGVAIGCLTQLADCSGSGSLDVAGNRVFVGKDVRQASLTAPGRLLMISGTDSLVIRGGLLGPVGVSAPAEFTVHAGNWETGILRVGGDFRAKGPGPGGAEGVKHNVFLDGAEVQQLHVLTGFQFNALTIADSLGVVLEDVAANGQEIVSVAADLNITTAASLSGNGRMEVLGNVQTTTGSSVTLRAIKVGSILRASGEFSPDTTEFDSPNVVQTIQSLPAYKSVVVRGKAIFGGSMTFGGSLIVQAGAELNVESRHVTVTERLIVNGLLRMQDGRDTLTVLGDWTIFEGIVENVQAFATAGVLRVGGGLLMDSATFYPSGSHKVVLVGDADRDVRGGFNNLDVAGSGAMRFRNALVRGDMTSSGPATVILDTLTVEGNASFAKRATMTVSSTSSATAVKSVFKGDLLAAEALTMAMNGKMLVEGNVSATDTLTMTGVSGGVFTAYGNFASGTGSAVAPKKLVVRGSLASSAGLSPDTLVAYGGSLPAGEDYKTVYVSGPVVAGGNVIMARLLVQCLSGLGFTVTCHSTTDAPAFDLNGRTIKVTGNLDHTRGKIIMTRPADTLDVRGNATFRNVMSRSTFTAGVLRVGGDLTSGSSTTASDTAIVFAAPVGDGTHTLGTKVIFDGSARQNVYGSDAEFLFSDIDVQNASATDGVVFGSTLGGTTTKFTVLGSIDIATMRFVSSTMKMHVAGNVLLKDGARLGAGMVVYKGQYSEVGTPAVPGVVTHARVHTVRWATQPTNRVAGEAFSPTLQVEVLDSLGSRLDASVPVSILLNNVIVRAVTVNGLKTFEGARATTATVGAGTMLSAYLWTPGTTALTEVLSDQFTVAPSTATHITLSRVAQTRAVASPVIAGANLTAQGAGYLLVMLQDEFGNRVTSGSGTVTLRTSDDSPDALYGTTTGTLSAGAAQITGAFAKKAGVYKLIPELAGYTSVVTDTFTVRSTTPAKIVLIDAPVNTVSGVIMSPLPAIEVRDTYDNPVDNLSSGQVFSARLTLTRIGGGTASSSPTYMPSNNKGLITFTDFRVTLATTQSVTYTATFDMTAFASLQHVTSEPFTISPP